MKIQKSMKRSTKQYIIVALICIVVIGGAATFTSIVITSQIRDEYQALLKEAYYDIEINQRDVYVAVADIVSGEAITADKIEKKTVYSSQPQETYIMKDEIGKIALINISSGTQIMNTMVTDNIISSELRELEYEVLNINSNIINNDTVDVRIFFPNGESYVILPKKIIKGYTQGTASCFFWLNEAELLRMSAAIVDAGLYTGAKLYTTKYIEPNIQDASIVTYTPNLSILTLLESDPNILERAAQELGKEVRKSLENRLASSLAVDVSAISWDVNPNVQINLTPTPIPGLDITNETAGEYESVPEESIVKSSDGTDSGSEDETGYYYYADEEDAKGGDTEYGE
ncbi:MAG: SAF domain-containing protein [Mobilitalea sp.]